MTAIYEAKFKIRYSEVGIYNQVKMVNVLNYFQDVAASHTAILGVSAIDLFNRGFAWVVRNYKITIHQYPLWDQEVTFRSWRCPFQRLYELRQFDVLDADENLLISAKTSWIMISLKSKRPVRLDRHLPASIAAYEIPIDNDFDEIEEQKDNNRQLPFKIRMHDLDFNRHVNNAIFVGWAVETVPQTFLKDHLPCTIEVLFLSEALYGDRILSMAETLTTHPDPVFNHLIIRESDQKVLTRLKTSWKPYSHTILQTYRK